MMKTILQSLLLFLCFSLNAQNSIGNEFLSEADLLRESGETLKAIDTYNKAIVAFQKERDYSGVFSSIVGRTLSWKHLFFQTEDPLYALFVQKDVEILKDLQEQHALDQKHTVLFLQGTAAYLQKDYVKAETEYQKAIELIPSNGPEKADWTAHLGEVMILNGKKEEGKQTTLKAIGIIVSFSKETDPFLHNVWLSGAYLRLAKALAESEPEESKRYLEKAKEIINQDKRLVIRQKQLEKFNDKPAVP